MKSDDVFADYNRKNGDVTQWNPVSAYVTLEMRVGVELCWPCRAQQKGSIENLIGFVEFTIEELRVSMLIATHLSEVVCVSLDH